MGIFSLRLFWVPLLATTLVAALLGAVLARSGSEQVALLGEQARLEARAGELQRGNERLHARRQALTCRLSAIERAARETLGMVGPGEYVAGYEQEPAPRARDADVPALTRCERALTSSRLPFVLPAAVFALSACVFAVWHALGAAPGRGAA